VDHPHRPATLEVVGKAGWSTPYAITSGLPQRPNRQGLVLISVDAERAEVEVAQTTIAGASARTLPSPVAKSSESASYLRLHRSVIISKDC
jgi:hypothetical protein